MSMLVRKGTMIRKKNQTMRRKAAAAAANRSLHQRGVGVGSPSTGVTQPGQAICMTTTTSLGSRRSSVAKSVSVSIPRTPTEGGGELGVQTCTTLLSNTNSGSTTTVTVTTNNCSSTKPAATQSNGTAKGNDTLQRKQRQSIYDTYAKLKVSHAFRYPCMSC